MSIDTHSTRRSTVHPESIEVGRATWLAVAGDPGCSSCKGQVPA